MSKRAAEAREEGRYPKKDFKKVYDVPQQTLETLVEAGIIDNSEWHHTSRMGNRTTFYGWAEEDFAERYARNKKEIDKLVKEVNANIAEIEKEERDFLDSWKGYQYPETFDWDAYSRRARELEELPINERTDILHSEFPETAEAENYNSRQREFSDKIYNKKREQKKRLQDLLEERIFGEASDALFRLTGEKGAAALDAKEGVTTRMDALELAKAMEARGYEAWEIEVATGWRQIKGGQWRYDLGKKRNNNDRELYNYDLTDEEKRAIQKYIETLPKKTDDSHPIAFENNGYIYTFNTKLDLYEENRRDGDGFEILKKYDLSNISNGEQREIESLSDTDIQSPNKVIVEFESEQDNNKSSSSYSAGTATAMEVDGVDIEADGNSQPGGRGNTGAGNENRRRNEEIGISREGDGTYTDEEINFANDPISKALGKPRGTRKQRREFTQRERQRMAERVHTLAEKLHLDNVEVVTDASALDGKKRRAKGFYFLRLYI